MQERSGDISENITRGVSAIREYDVGDISHIGATRLASMDFALGAETLALPLRPPHPVIGAPKQLGLDFPEPQRIHFTLSRFDNGAETLSRPMCAEGVL